MSERGFLSRWSQRKLEAEQVEAPTPKHVELETDPDMAGVATSHDLEKAAHLDPEVVENLPDIESLDAESDFTGFMQQGVPAELKKLALRKLWSSNPIFANLDGLNDYDDDFASVVPLAEGVAEELKRLMKENRQSIPEEQNEEDVPVLTENEEQHDPVIEAEGELNPETVSDETENLRLKNDKFESGENSNISINYEESNVLEEQNIN